MEYLCLAWDRGGRGGLCISERLLITLYEVGCLGVWHGTIEGRNQKRTMDLEFCDSRDLCKLGAYIRGSCTGYKDYR